MQKQELEVLVEKFKEATSDAVLRLAFESKELVNDRLRKQGYPIPHDTFESFKARVKE